ncbi:glycosyl hydrolase family 8 [Sporosarcina koreensis]|uniref:glycosyl hydrolase family 8 n=1 Tax=Sporosarcina koreensis TaxID=334735 RepID=UPI000754EC38|nr:glycosyl hydrolase family 8 [Sporosarcina koreensis]
MGFRNTCILIISLLLIIGVASKVTSMKKQEGAFAKSQLSAEQFILEHFMKKDGRIQTDLLGQSDVYLSETVGLWMEYLLAKDDVKQFDQQVHVLEEHFLTKDYLVTWEVRGMASAPANASIDDLRIMNALFEAGRKWNKTAYTKLALKMGEGLGNYQINGGLMVDYIDLKSKYQGTTITLSYIIPSAFDFLKENNFIPQRIYDDTVSLLVEIPYTSLGFFPKAYDIKTKHFSYDEEVNLIDQYYIGYHRAQWGGDVMPLLDFTKEAFSKGNGKLYGRYDSKTGTPLVDYEAPAVYALAILMCLEIGEADMARALLAQMQTLQQMDETEEYYGGYIDVPTLDTHTFDNLLALLAERKGIDEEVFR